jgi:plasmid stabilization system protein ParE
MGKPAGYQVFWHAAAEQQLAAIWMVASERRAVSAAADACDQALRHDPQAVGESREGPYRISIMRPLAFIFRVSESDHSVWVMRVRHVRPSD